ncbi:MAG: hypothetical protein ACLUOD_11835 [[Clostridium] innocuum]
MEKEANAKELKIEFILLEKPSTYLWKNSETDLPFQNHLYLGLKGTTNPSEQAKAYLQRINVDYFGLQKVLMWICSRHFRKPSLMKLWNNLI